MSVPTGNAKAARTQLRVFLIVGFAAAGIILTCLGLGGTLCLGVALGVALHWLLVG
jgi:hypothetical protein